MPVNYAIQRYEKDKKMDKRAFTLAELLTAVLVISIIMVALAPVITKRMKDNVSVTTDNKKGLEIFANPGTYTFDVPIGINTLFLQGSGGGGGGGGAGYIEKQLTFDSSTEKSFVIPKGVNQLTFTLTGAGGGGGGGNAVLVQENCKSSSKLIGFADNGKDLCVSAPITPEIHTSGTVINVVGSGVECTQNNCCWKDAQSAVYSDTSYTGVSAKARTTCKYHAANAWCIASSALPGFAKTAGLAKPARLLSVDEARRILDNTHSDNTLNRSVVLGKSGLDACRYEEQKTINRCEQDGLSLINNPYDLSKLATCSRTPTGTCPGSTAGACYPNRIWLKDGYVFDLWYSTLCAIPSVSEDIRTNDFQNPYSVFCAYELDNWKQYGGAGGNSGAIFTRTINVLPGDIIKVKAGQGGAGGAKGMQGLQGTPTQLIHLRNNITMGTYKVLGAFGGKNATTSNNGEALENGTSSNQTTPAGTCFAQYRTSVTGELIGGNTACTQISNSGSSGDTLNGGNGAKLTGASGEAASGGGIDHGDEIIGKGYTPADDLYGFGGGGGSCQRRNNVYNSPNAVCQGGGDGAGGFIDITFRVMLPGGGGGAGTRVGGTTDAGVSYEIKYKVQEGSRIVFEVGSGGSGGSQGQDGANGTPTVIGSNDLIFLAGHGGYSITQSQKNSLSNCIGTNEDSTIIGNCIDNANYKAKGGEASRMTVDYEEYTGSNALGLIVNTANVSHSIVNTKYKGYDGKKGSQNRSVVPFTYGFDGGVGGAPFGIRPNNIIGAITCGGGLSGNNGLQTDPEQYICTSGSPNANNAKPHDSANNEFGGSGGGGGGVVDTSFDLGSGGSGSNGYLRIRWDASEQE